MANFYLRVLTSTYFFAIAIVSALKLSLGWKVDCVCELYLNFLYLPIGLMILANSSKTCFGTVILLGLIGNDLYHCFGAEYHILSQLVEKISINVALIGVVLISQPECAAKSDDKKKN